METGREAVPPGPAAGGLGGWLIILALVLFIAPLTRLGALHNISAFFDQRVWLQFTTPGEARYNAFWARGIYFELVTNICGLIFNLLLIVLFFQKRRSFPILMITMLGFNIVALILDNVLVQKLNVTAGSSQLVGAVFGGGLWIAYLLRSKRVATTFVRRSKRVESAAPTEAPAPTPDAAGHTPPPRTRIVLPPRNFR